MKHSEYINWAKARHKTRYNLASSGVPAPLLDVLGMKFSDWTLTEEQEDGWPVLLERIAARYGVGADQVALAQGAQMANHLVFALFLEPGDHVLLERPCYEPLHVVPGLFGASTSFFDRAREARFALDVSAVEKGLTDETKLVVLTDLHNPTGQRLDASALEELAALAAKREFHVLVDEVYLEWLHDEGARTAAHVSPRFVTTRSLTKAYGLDAVRAGWILGSEEVAERLRRLVGLYAVKMAHASERLAVRAIDHADAILQPHRNRLAHHQRIVQEWLDAHDELSWEPPTSGSVGLVYWDGADEKKVDRLVLELEARDALVSPGRFFGVPGAFRVGFGMASDALDEGLSRLDDALSSV